MTTKFLFQAPWLKVDASNIQIDAASLINANESAPDYLRQSGVKTDEGGDCTNNISSLGHLVLLEWFSDNYDVVFTCN